MLRLIEIGNQITCDPEEPDKQFAWYDTSVERFVTIAGCQTWRSWAEFERDYIIACRLQENPPFNLERFRALFPKNGITIGVD